MASVHDVAAYIIERQGSMTAMKLQKLAYYSQAWHLVWDEEPLFDDDVQAWANGPVVRALYNRHRGQFAVSSWPTGDASKLSDNERETVDAVVGFYGAMTAHQLSELTHGEDPWKLAREGVGAGVRSEAVITQTAMFEYYDGLTTG